LPCDDTKLAARTAFKHSNLALTAAALAVAAVLVGCSSPSKRETPPESTAAPAAPATPSATGKAAVRLPAPDSPKSWADARLQAARRLVAANPDGSYTGKPPDILMAIPVLTIELNGDGSIRNISVMRYPSQARETVEMAMAAIKRAAPFGDVSRLPKPWKFNETFLFKDDYKFKPMTLDR